MCRMCIVDIDTGRGPGAAARVHDPGGRRHGGRHRVAGHARRRRTACSSSCSSTTRSTARCATRAASARCRTRRYAYGPGESRFVEEKRHFEKPIPISDLVLLDRERCILCDRCTRFADEVAGDPLIHFIEPGRPDRGQHLPRPPVRVVLQRQHRADLPGRRAHRPSRTGSRPGPWDLEQVESHLHDVLGRLPHRRRSRRRNRVLRYLGVDIDPVNWGWLCDKGRFDFEAVEPRRPPEPSRWSRDGDELVRGDVGRGARPRRPTPSHGRARQRRRRARRRARRRPPHQRGGLRLGEAGQGRARHRQRRLPARRRPAGRGRARPAPGHHRRRLRRRRHGACCSRPTSRRSCRSSSCGCATPCVEHGVKVVELSPAATGAHAATPPRRCATGPGEAGLGGARARRRRRRRAPLEGDAGRGAEAARSRASRSRSCSAGRRWPSRPTPIVDAAAALLDACPAAGSCPRCAGATCTARSTWAWRPGCCPAGSRSTTAGEWFARRVGRGAGRAPGLDATGHPHGRGRRRDRRARAARRRPARRLPRPRPRRAGRSPAPAPSSPSTRSSPSRSQQADVVLAAAGYAETGGHHHQHRGPGQPLDAEGHAAGHGPGRLDASPPSCAYRLGGRPRPRVGRGHLGRDRAARPVARGHHRRRARGRRRPRRRGRAARPRASSRRRRHAGLDRQPAPRSSTDGAGRRRRRGRGGRRRRRERPSEAASSRRRRRRRRAAPATAVGRAPARTLAVRRRGPSGRSRARPAVDAYSLRLVATRKLYDHGTARRSTRRRWPAWPPGRALRAQPRTTSTASGSPAGGRVTVVVAAGRVTARRRSPTPACPRARAAMCVNHGERRPAPTSSTPPQPVTDVRVETRRDRSAAGDPLLVGGRRPRRRPRSSSLKTVVVLRPAARRHDAHGLVRAQGHRRHAEPHRPQPGRPVRHPPDARRRHQALLQGGPAPRPGRPARLPAWRPYLSVVPAFLVVRGRPHRRRLQRRQATARSSIFGHDTFLQLADPPIGILFVLACRRSPSTA